MSVLLSEPARGTDPSPLSVQLLRAGLGNELCDLKAGGWLGGGSESGLGSKSLSDDAQENVIQRELVSRVHEG